MQYLWFVLIGAAAVASAEAQDIDPFAAGMTTEFFLSHSPCLSRHDPSVEKALPVIAVRENAARPPDKAGSVATVVEMRNGSNKAITAYMFTVTRGHKTDYVGARGKDLVYPKNGG